MKNLVPNKYKCSVFKIINLFLEGKDDNLLNESIASMMPGRPAAMPMSPNKPVGSGTAASNNLSYMDNTANCSQSGIDWDEDSRLEPLEEEERNFDDDIDFGSVLRADIKVSSGNSVAGGGDCSSDEFLNLFTVVSKSVDRAGYDDIGNSNYSGTKKLVLSFYFEYLYRIGLNLLKY